MDIEATRGEDGDVAADDLRRRNLHIQESAFLGHIFAIGVPARLSPRTLNIGPRPDVTAAPITP